MVALILLSWRLSDIHRNWGAERHLKRYTYVHVCYIEQFFIEYARDPPAKDVHLGTEFLFANLSGVERHIEQHTTFGLRIL